MHLLPADRSGHRVIDAERICQAIEALDRPEVIAARARQFAVLADPSRRQVLDLLVSHGAVSASWLAGRVPFTRQAVSKHLVVLERAGLISRRKQGREVLYQVEADRLDQAARAMAELAAQWDRRLGAIKRLAEAAHAETSRARGNHEEEPHEP